MEVSTDVHWDCIIFIGLISFLKLYGCPAGARKGPKLFKKKSLLLPFGRLLLFLIHLTLASTSGRSSLLRVLICGRRGQPPDPAPPPAGTSSALISCRERSPGFISGDIGAVRQSHLKKMMETALFLFFFFLLTLSLGTIAAVTTRSQ